MRLRNLVKINRLYTFFIDQGLVFISYSRVNDSPGSHELSLYFRYQPNSGGRPPQELVELGDGIKISRDGPGYSDLNSCIFRDTCMTLFVCLFFDQIGAIPWRLMFHLSPLIIAILCIGFKLNYSP